MIVILYCVRLDTVDSVKGVLGKWGKKAVETTKKGQDLAGNMWQHCKHLIPVEHVLIFSVSDVEYAIVIVYGIKWIDINICSDIVCGKSRFLM